MDWKISYSGDGAVLTFEGEITIEHAGEVKVALMRALEDTASVIVNVEKVTDADLSCLELFCSAHRTFVKLNKGISLSENKPGILKQIVKEAGYSRHKGCHLDVYKSCIWADNFSKDGTVSPDS